jgi:hypothetical protein
MTDADDITAYCNDCGRSFDDVPMAPMLHDSS